VLEDLCQEDPQRFAARRLPANVGNPEALRQGILHAFEAGPDYIGYWDADLATPLEVIPAFCELLDARPDLEMVFGARVHMLGRTIERKALRHDFGRVFATAASVVLGPSVYDTQCGAKLFRAMPAIKSLFLDPFATRGLRGQAELIAVGTTYEVGLAMPTTTQGMWFASCTGRTGAGVHARPDSGWVPIPEQVMMPTCSAAFRVTSSEAGIGAADDPQPVLDRCHGMCSPAARAVRSIGGQPEMIAKRPC
jgi:hypothetical protein